MFTIEEFQELTFEKKCNLVTFNASYLTFRISENLQTFLYDSGEYFIEVFYSKIDQRVLGFNAFSDISGLEAYLETISLEGLPL